MRRDESRQGLAQTGVGQYEVVIHLEQDQLLPQARFALAERVAPTPNRRHALPDVGSRDAQKRQP